MGGVGPSEVIKKRLVKFGWRVGDGVEREREI